MITNGRIRREQLALCVEAFASAPETAARIVVTHHHWVPAPDYEQVEVMPGAKQALDVLTELRVDLILSGHLHRASIGNSLDVYGGRDREHGILIVQCGTSTSRRGRAREREKNSFNWLRITDRLIRITHYMYFMKIGDFAPVSHHLFPRASQLFLQTPLTSTIPGSS
jgi:3',5'-cyclic AMP phosphodiesterase CpdA